MPALGSRGLGDLGPTLWRQLVSPRNSAPLSECLGGLVLARIAHVFLDLARQNLGDVDRGGHCVGGSFLALWSLRHINPDSCLTPSMIWASGRALRKGIAADGPQEMGSQASGNCSTCVLLVQRPEHQSRGRDSRQERQRRGVGLQRVSGECPRRST